MSVLGDGRAHGEVVTNLRHIWRTKFLFANILDRANCSCLFTSTSISPQVSPKTLKHSAKLSELFSVRNFFPTIFVLRKICRRKFTVDEFCEEKFTSVKVANHCCVSQVPTNKIYAVRFTVTKSFVVRHRAGIIFAICCDCLFYSMNLPNRSQQIAKLNFAR